jgi:RNA polymerase-associated protein LEO1
MMADDQATIEDLFGSDSEEEPQQEAQPASKNALEVVDAGAANGSAPQADQLRDLFGSDHDEGDDDAGPAKPSSAAALADADDAYYREPTPEEEEEVLRGPPMHVTVPLHDILDTEQLRLTKLSNIIAIEPRPFDPETYEPNGVEYVDERGHKRVRLHDTNAIRWRWAADADGNHFRESNSRLVRWSDGSVTLSVGDEVMDVREIDVSGDHSFLFARHSNLIQGQGPLNKKITLRPASLTSTSHKRLAAAVVKHHGNSRQQRVRATTTLVDPKKEKEDQERAEAARIKDLEKLADKQQKQMKKYKSPSSYGGGGSSRAYGVSRNRPTALNARFLEEDEEEEEEEEEDDDGFIVRDEDMERGEGGGAGELEDEDDDDDEYEEDMDVGRLVSRPRARNYEEEAEAERRLAAAKLSAPPAAPGGGGGGVLKDSDDEEEEGEEKRQQRDSSVKKKPRAMLMQSDSE